MRHVRKKLGFVLRGQRQLDRLFFKRVAGLLNFRVLALDFRVLVGKQFGLGSQFLIGLLQLALAGLQFGRELLRLGEEALGAHRCFDGVEDGAQA